MVIVGYYYCPNVVIVFVSVTEFPQSAEITFFTRKFRENVPIVTTSQDRVIVFATLLCFIKVEYFSVDLMDEKLLVGRGILRRFLFLIILFHRFFSAKTM